MKTKERGYNGVREIDGGVDFSKDQYLMSIRQDGGTIGDVEVKDGKLVTCGAIGYNTYDNFVQLIFGLQGFNIRIDNFVFIKKQID